MRPSSFAGALYLLHSRFVCRDYAGVIRQALSLSGDAPFGAAERVLWYAAGQCAQLDCLSGAAAAARLKVLLCTAAVRRYMPLPWSIPVDMDWRTYVLSLPSLDAACVLGAREELSILEVAAEAFAAQPARAQTTARGARTGGSSAAAAANASFADRIADDWLLSSRVAYLKTLLATNSAKSFTWYRSRCCVRACDFCVHSPFTLLIHISQGTASIASTSFTASSAI